MTIARTKLFDSLGFFAILTLVTLLQPFISIRVSGGSPPVVQISSNPYPDNGQLVAIENEDVTLQELDNGFGAIRQWRKNGIPLERMTNGTLHLAKLKDSDAGKYTVAVTAGGATTESSAISISVFPGIKVSLSPSSPIRLGTPVQVFAQIPPGVSQIQWFHNGGGAGIVGNNSITIAAAGFSNAGTYYVRAFFPNVGRYVSGPIVSLSVYKEFAPPEVVVQPRDWSGNIGGTAVFAIGVSGTPPFIYQWYKRGDKINQATNFFIKLEHLEPSDQSAYSCTVTGVGGGSASSLQANLTIESLHTNNPTADSLVTSGRAALALRQNSSVSAAAVTFATAVGIDPQNDVANAFLAIARLANIVNQAGFNGFLDRLGVSRTNREIFHWKANFAQTTNHHVTFPGGLNTMELPIFAKTNLLSEMIGAEKSLDAAQNTDLVIHLSKEEAGGEEIDVDQGDLAVIRSALHFGSYFVRTINSWNTSTQVGVLNSLADADLLTVEQVFGRYPQLLTFADPDDVGLARIELEAAIDWYVQGSAFIRSRPGNDSLQNGKSEVRVFNLNLGDNEGEGRFRQSLIDLKASMRHVVVLNEAPKFEIDSGLIFATNRSPRSLLPEFKLNSADASSLPKTNYANIISGIGSPQILIQPVSRTPFQIGVLAVGQEPLRYQWNLNGVPILDSTNNILPLRSIGAGGTNRLNVVVANGAGSIASKSVLMDTTYSNLYLESVLNADGLVALTGKAPPGLVADVETSVDLNIWTRVTTVQIPANGLLSFIPFSPVDPKRFYRIVAR